MAREIADKAQQMKRSGASWLRVVLLTGLWPMTEWGKAPLERKLETMATWLADELGAAAPAGVVMSSAAAFYNGQVTSETVQDQHGVGVRRAIEPFRARETLIFPLRPEGRRAVGDWRMLADAEPGYLNWALLEAGLPGVSDIFCT